MVSIGDEKSPKLSEHLSFGAAAFDEDKRSDCSQVLEPMLDFKSTPEGAVSSQVDIIRPSKENFEAGDAISERLDFTGVTSPFNTISQQRAGQQLTETKLLFEQQNHVYQLMQSFGLEQDIVESVYNSCGRDMEKSVEVLSEMTESMGIEKYTILKTTEEGNLIIYLIINKSFQ